MVSRNEIEGMLEYIPEGCEKKFRELASDLRIYITRMKEVHNVFDDDLPRYAYHIRIERISTGAYISFTFYDSHYNWRLNKRPTRYDIRACCGFGYTIPDDYLEFCQEFGYDPDDPKIKKLFNKAAWQKRKLEKIFTPEEAACLPS